MIAIIWLLYLIELLSSIERVAGGLTILLVVFLFISVLLCAFLNDFEEANISIKILLLNT